MTHTIKQIADTDGEPMMEVVVNSDCSAADMDAIHAEALELNAAIDDMIAGRQRIADKKPEFMQEIWDLVRLGCAYKEAGHEWYRWAKATAIRLWEHGFTTGVCRTALCKGSSSRALERHILE